MQGRPGIPKGGDPVGKLTVELSGMTLKNPVIPASGTYGYGMDYLDFYDVNILGSFSIKGTTLHPREGNGLPRICEYDQGMLNSVGLQNPGVHDVAEKIFPELKKVYHGQVIANISGFSFDEYVECAKIMDREDIVGILELNISCPNVHGGGASFGTDIPTAVEVLKRVKQAVRKPVYVKCTPQCPDLVGMCRALEENGADGLVLSNTFLGIRLDRRTGKPIMKNITGGVSGPGIFPQALYKVYQVYPHVHIPIIGCGGISTADDIIEMMSAGAAAVEIGTLNLTDPQRIPQIITELEQLCDTLHVESITEITGRAHR